MSNNAEAQQLLKFPSVESWAELQVEGEALGYVVAMASKQYRSNDNNDCRTQYLLSIVF